MQQAHAAATEPVTDWDYDSWPVFMHELQAGVCLFLVPVPPHGKALHAVAVGSSLPVPVISALQQLPDSQGSLPFHAGHFWGWQGRVSELLSMLRRASPSGFPLPVALDLDCTCLQNIHLTTEAVEHHLEQLDL